MKTHWTDHVTTRGWIVFFSLVAAAAIFIGFKTGDRCYPTFSAGSCFAMIDAQVGK